MGKLVMEATQMHYPALQTLAAKQIPHAELPRELEAVLMKVVQARSAQ